MFQKQRIITAALIALGSVVHGNTISDTQSDLIAWVETKKTISETASNWSAEKEIVTDLIGLLENEKEKYEAGIEKLEGSSDATDKLRSSLNADKEALLAVDKALESVIPELEAKVLALIPLLPEPLVEEIDPLIRRLPDANEKTRLPISQRLLTVVGILNKIDKFNSGISIKSEIRSVADASAEVTTLYFGLAGAFFTNDSGSYAGTGKPGTDGWVWTEDPSIAPKIVSLIGSYKGTREAKFVELPIEAL